MRCVDVVKRTVCVAVGLGKVAQAESLGSAVLGAWRRRPDGVKVSRRVSAIIPVHDVAADVRRHVPIKGDHSASQTLADIADRTSATE